MTTMLEPMPEAQERTAAIAAARTGDEVAFGALVTRHRRELQVHCYRMLGSFDEAEDLVQETFLRAWRHRESYEARASLRAWLYRIATNACLDALARRPRSADGEITWLQPFPDHLLDELEAADAGPEAVAIERETIELAFLAAIQRLAPRARAAIVLRDVLGWSAKEAAAVLGTSVASVTSALQRGRETLRDELPQRRVDWAPGTDATAAERALLQRYMDASEQGDVDGLAALLADDLRWSMPPQPGRTETREAAIEAWTAGGFASPEWGAIRCSVTRVNRQPAVVNHLLRPGDTRYRAMALDVLSIADGRVAEIVTFSPAVFPSLGLPTEL